jgi:PhnB protein
MNTVLTSETKSTPSTGRRVQPYVFFDGCCEAALDFYVTNLGARINQLLRCSESPEKNACMENVPGDKILHASFQIGDTELFASDGMSSGAPKFEGFALSLSVPTAAAAEKTFNALANGGTVTMPLARTFFSPCFGMVTDRFGVNWMLIVPA